MVESPYPVLEGAPYFNFQSRHFLIEGAYQIIPTKPIEVGHTRQLLMDNHVVDSTWNCFRKVHQPDKYADNPVIEPTDALRTSAEGSVLYDDEQHRFRLWGFSNHRTRAKFDMNAVHVTYESEDGIDWTAPELGIVEDEGSTANNIFQGGKGLIFASVSVVEVPQRLRSRGRYAMLYGFGREQLAPGELHAHEQRIAWSDDGLHWRDQPENPVFRGRSDTDNNMEYNPQRNVFMMYRRATVNAHEIRRIAYSESKDLIAWTQPQVILDADSLDAPMLYGMTVTRYQGVYLGFLQMFYGANAGYRTGSRLWRDGRVEKSQQVDIQLAWSRDGVHWERHPQRPIFLPTGVHGVDMDWGLVYMDQGIVEHGDRLHLYYRGGNRLHNQPSAKMTTHLATLRRDGFVSLGTPEVGPGPGYMLTRPLACPGGKLHINARTEAGGLVRVAVRSGDGAADGDWLDGWNFEDGAPFTGDAIDATVGWTGHENFDRLEGRSIRLHFWLQKADLYSFWFGD